jgi:CubicO group peptidase (beta-lactamase class C family)
VRLIAPTEVGEDSMEELNERLAEILSRAELALAERGVVSLALAVARDGALLWDGAVGWANRERRQPATPHTMYSLASISKPMTATAIMLLVARGQLDLDAPIDDYLGDAKLNARAFDGREATVRRVLNHTAGLPLHYQFFYADEPWRRPAMDETIRRYANLVSAPGERFQYSNLGYGVLDYVIERVSGQAYADFMRTEVFGPLGMTRSGVDVPAQLADFAAARYGHDLLPYPFYDFDHPGASAIFSSANDLARFGALHAGARLPGQPALLPDDLLAEMQRLDGDGYALGWGIAASYGGVRRVSHDGGMGGVSTQLWLIPAERITVVALTNSTTNRSGPKLGAQAAEDVLAALLPSYAEQLPALRAAPPSAPQPAPYTPTPQLLGSWKGAANTYVGERPLQLNVQADGDIHARLGAQLKTLVNDATWDDGWLTGCFQGDIETPDASRRRHQLHLDLRLRDGILNGALMAISTQDREGGAPDVRVGNALAHWVALERTD